MQVNIFRGDFTEITMYVLRGQETEKKKETLKLSVAVLMTDSTCCSLEMEKYSSPRLTWNIMQVISVF